MDILNRDYGGDLINAGKASEGTLRKCLTTQIRVISVVSACEKTKQIEAFQDVGRLVWERTVASDAVYGPVKPATLRVCRQIHASLIPAETKGAPHNGGKEPRRRREDENKETIWSIEAALSRKMRKASKMFVKQVNDAHLTPLNVMTHMNVSVTLCCCLTAGTINRQRVWKDGPR